MRLTRFNSETGQYEYIEKARTLDEFRAQRKAVIQKLGELEDRAEGEWKSNEHGGYVCSECGCWLEDYYGATPEMMKYCFDCGAKMDGERREG